MKDQAQAAGLQEKIRKVSPEDFESVALQVFQYQATHNPVYREYLRLLRRDPASVSQLSELPFLPISFFKTHTLKSGEWPAGQIFTSSGTSGSVNSRHHIRDPDFYLENARRGFTRQYGPVEGYLTLALLPSYLERSGSSLVAMAQDFIRRSDYPQSGFFLYNTDELLEIIALARKNGWAVLLLGVSFALLDLAEAHPQPMPGVTIMETGGMKGRRRELTREELHRRLKAAFEVPVVHSEYGMTELLSQAYSPGDGRFYPSETMRVLSREITDPLSPQSFGRTGALNIIDLANLHTISFIATDDLGRVYDDYSFEVLGRLDASDVRGCNLMVADVQQQG